MAPVAAVLFVSLALAGASMAVPILPRAAPTTVDSVSASTSTSTSPSDASPTLAFTFGPGPSGLPHVSASTAATAQGTAPATTLVLEMDWLS
ncbi:hypothetical protein LXA43DRAFT_1103338 [Ganoderma leucocontextum]|nr:hypothetical protein LXA43DRAFT_1103338 [Ganoderma leucocontextum]